MRSPVAGSFSRQTHPDTSCPPLFVPATPVLQYYDLLIIRKDNDLLIAFHTGYFYITAPLAFHKRASAHRAADILLTNSFYHQDPPGFV